MFELEKNLFVGDIEEYTETVRFMPDMNVVIAAKEPYHREIVGYKTRGCPKDSPFYYTAKIKNGIVCNLIDGNSKEYIPDEIIFCAVEFIRNCLFNNQPVFICCNQGKSRSPIIALLAVAYETPYNSLDFETAYNKLKERYSLLDAGKGMYDYALEKWEFFKQEAFQI